MANSDSPWLKSTQEIRVLETNAPGGLVRLEEQSRRVYHGSADRPARDSGESETRLQSARGVIIPERDPMATREIVLERRLGAGGAGVVFRGRISAGAAPVAVKVYPGAVAAREGSLNPLSREAHADLSIQHPNIRRVFGQGEGELQLDGHEPELCSYVLMAYIKGWSLAKWLKRFTLAKRSLPIERAVEIVLIIAKTLTVVHRQAKSHGDLKLSNVMVENGRTLNLSTAPLDAIESALKIVDFGQAVADGEPRTGGTRFFIAPEQKGSHVGDRRSDIFALGQMLRFLIHGKEPEAADSLRIALADRGRWRHFARESAHDLLAIVAKCIAADPNDRYPDAGSLANALGHWLKRQPVPATGIPYSRYEMVRLLLLRCRLFNNGIDHSDLWGLAFLLFASVAMTLSTLAAILELGGVDRQVAFDGTGAVNSFFVIILAGSLCWLTRNSRLTKFTASVGIFYLAAMAVLRYGLLPHSSLAESVQLLLTAQVFFMASYFDVRWSLFRRLGIVVLVLAAISPSFVGGAGFGPFQAMLQGWTLSCGELLFSYNLLRRRGSPFRRHLPD